MIKLLKEIRDLLKEILAELKQQKEPTAVTVNSKKVNGTIDFLPTQQIDRMSGQQHDPEK